VLALIGKTNYYWQYKGWHRVIDVWHQLEDSSDFLVVSQGVGLEDFRSYVHSRIGYKVVWRGFLPPWEMPELLNSVDGLFCYEADLPSPVFSNIAVEALFCGVTLFADAERIIDHYYAHGLDLDHRVRQIVTLPGDNFAEVTEILKGLPANVYLDSLHAKPRSREEEQQQDTAWTAGFVRLQANMYLCCLDTELQAKSLR
jgi:glycosyltransferase involved in cell wall biosynthesis